MGNPCLFLPNYGPEADGISPLFEAARKKMRRAWEDDDMECFIEGSRGYLEAFESGVLEAGVNMLALAMSASFSIALGENDLLGFELNYYQDFIQSYTSILDREHHPAGMYYLALALIYGFFRLSPSREDDSDAGRYLMVSLAKDGNKYASNFVDSCTTYQRETSLSQDEISDLTAPILHELPVEAFSVVMYLVAR